MTSERAIRNAKILIVDDQAANVRLLEAVLSAFEFTNVVSTTDSRQVLTLCAASHPDIVLLDLQMPAPDGFEVMRQLGSRTQCLIPLPILVLTADRRRETKAAALSLGASDFLAKPFDQTEVALRVKNLITTRLMQIELRDKNLQLEDRVRERTRELEKARLEIVDRLALAAEYRDDDTGAHTRRVGHLSALLATRLGLRADTVELIRRAAALHDVGKIAIPDAILLKPGKLTGEEFEAMKEHAKVGGEILAGSESDLLRMSAEIALSHHEWWDGSGYPSGLKEDAIPLSGRIVAVADTFDALTHARPYKQAWPTSMSVEEIRRLSGRQFDPAIVDAFEQLDIRELAQGGEPRPRLVALAQARG